MALINCYECQRQISDQATSCPNCGAPVQKTKGVSTYITNSTKGKEEIIMGWMLLLAMVLWGYLKFYWFAGGCGVIGIMLLFKGKFLHWYHWK